MSPRHYVLRCQECGDSYEDDGLRLECSNRHAPALLSASYSAERFDPDPSIEGIFRYSDWLPVERHLPRAGRTVTYRSEALCRRTGLRNLWIAFNGYWPEKGAMLETGTFKQLEAYAVLSRIPAKSRSVLVVASAGNTARAFAYSCSRIGSPCLIVLPADAMCHMRFRAPLDPCVKLVSLEGAADYSDAIALAARISALDGFFPEGGVKNVARRDGIGTTILSAVETMGRLPDYYFQAIGSGTGGIAVHEASKRLLKDGRYGDRLPRLMLSQNLPFAPIYHSWKSARRELIQVDSAGAKVQARQVLAQVLTNRQPPYAVMGGVFDVLRESLGDMLSADNDEALEAVALFKETEGIDCEPAAAVALATLIRGAREGLLEPSAFVLLHVTGGRCPSGAADESVPARPALTLGEEDLNSPEALQKVAALFD